MQKSREQVQDLSNREARKSTTFSEGQTSFISNKSQEKAKNLYTDDEEQSIDQFTVEENDTTSIQEEADKHEPWSSLDAKQKTKRAVLLILKIVAAIVLLYFFICSIQILSRGFRIVGGAKPQSLISRDALKNPVVGLMGGVLFTVVVQSSSVTTAAIVSLVAQRIISVEVAIPIVMGSNVGTSLTNTILAMLQLGNRDRFRRAFAAATLHDMFNWLATLVLLPVECATGFLLYGSRFLLLELDPDELEPTRNSHFQYQPLNYLTDPVTNLIVRINKTVTNSWSHPNETIREWSKKQSVVANSGHMMANTGWGDRAIGGVVLCIAFFLLLLFLILLVNTLKSILKGQLAIWIRKISHGNLPHCPSLTDYLLILMGMFLTVLVQSSSVFTSILPPLVSIKALSLERSYCLTLGSNIGTCTTALIVAFAQTVNYRYGLQIALCHLLFNLTGVLLFFPIKWTRFPIPMAKFLGKTTAQYRWFAIVYVLFLFILLPLMFMGLAFAGTIYIITVACLLCCCFLSIVSINSLRVYKRFLPERLHSWKWLPVWMRSLEPYDRVFSKLSCCKRLINRTKSSSTKNADQDPYVIMTEEEAEQPPSGKNSERTEPEQEQEDDLNVVKSTTKKDQIQPSKD